MSSKNRNKLQVMVLGGLNTDIIGLGIKELLKPGELTLGGNFVVGPGGKSRNIAQMVAALLGKNKVAMVGKTSKDPFNLWRLPVDALIKAGVNTEFIKILKFDETRKYPGIALIPVNTKGQNQIYVLPGINDDFLAKDIDDAELLFTSVKKNNGILTMSLELPLKTAIYAIKKAKHFGIRVILDTGGISKDENYTELLAQEIFMIKPNEYETKILTGVEVKDFRTAGKAADCFNKKGINNILITHGKNGAYLFCGNIKQHIPVPNVKKAKLCDETGCGDQVTAALCAGISHGKDILEASRDAILAGTLQFHKVGIKPITFLPKYR
ncbi:MAG: PfkB family carbohydrate kinase [Elusimicrobia bacterium]|nr:PfkB family carbohydrate kinase [Elusimicrobiota bacterium]